MNVRVLLVVLGIAAAIAGCSSDDNTRSAPTTPSITPAVGAADADASVALCREAAAQQLKDPSSPMYRNVTVNTYHPGEWTVSGEINGKNSFNAYSGYQKFGCIVVVKDGQRTATNVYVLG